MEFVFLSHNSQDKALVEVLARGLQEHGVKPWLDIWELIPGRPWLEEIESAIRESTSVAVCVGPSGLGRVQKPELRVALDGAFQDPSRKVIPVLLPGGPDPGELPEFLKARTCVDLRAESGGVGSGGLRRLAAAVADRAPGPPPRGDAACPYKGLHVFGEADARLYFGRDKVKESLVGLLRDGRRLLIIVGASGSGKSSLLRAGLLPAVRTGAIDGRYDATILTLRPGERPLRELALRLVQWGGGDPSEISRLEHALASDPHALVDYVALNGDAEFEPATLILAVDQLEEAFATGVDSRTRGAFLAALLEASRDRSHRVRVLATLRADFLGRALDHSGERAAVLRDGLELIVPLERDEIRDAVERPALQAGVRFEDGLSEALIETVAGQPGDLPLLQFALEALWRERRGNLIPWEAYRRMGGVQGAVRRHAEAFVRQNARREPALRRMLVRLVQLGEGTQDTRRRARRTELIALAPEAGQEILDALIAERLATVDEDTVELAHDSLISQWNTLRKWVDEDREALRLQLAVARAAEQWLGDGRGDDDLLRGARLDDALELRERSDVRLSADESAFLDASLAARELAAAEAHAQRRQALRQAQALADAERQRADAEAHRALAERDARERLRKRGRLLSLILAALACALLAAGWWAFEAETAQGAAVRAQNEAEGEAARATEAERQVRDQSRRFRDAQLVSAARWALSERDATAAALLLGEVGSATETPGWLQIAIDVAAEPRARSIIRGKFGEAAVSPDGERVLVVPTPSTLQILRPDGRGERVTLPAPPFGLRSAVFSPDGQRVLLLRLDGVAVLRRADGEGDEIPLGERVRSAAFSPDGARVMTESWDSTVRTWRANGTEEALLPPRRDEPPLLAIKFSPDGRRLAVLSRVGPARVWWPGDVDSPVFLKHGAHAKEVSFSPTGSRVLTLSNDNEARLWRVDRRQKPELLQVLEGHTAEIQAAAFSPDGTRVVTTASDETTRVWDLERPDAPVVLEHLPGNPRTTFFTPDGERVVTAMEGGAMWMWRADGSGHRLPLLGHNDTVRSTRFSPDGSRLATASEDGTTRVWNLATPVPPRVLPGDGTPMDLAVFGPDGQSVFSVLRAGGVIAWRPGQATLPIYQEQPRRDVVSWGFSNGRAVANIGTRDGVQSSWVVGHGHKPRSLGSRANESNAYGAQLGAIVASPDGRRVVELAEDGTYTWATDAPGKAAARVGHESDARFAAVSPDGQRILVISKSSVARIWRADQPDGPTMLTLGGVSSTCGAFSPDGEHVVIGTYGGGVVIWRVDGSDASEYLSTEDTPIHFVTFSQDGSRVAAISSSNVVRVWRVEFPDESIELQGVANDPNLPLSVQFSPDGSLLAAASDKVTYVWPTEEAGEPVTLAGHPQAISSFAFSSDSRRVATLDVRGEVRVFRADGVGDPLRLPSSSWLTASVAFSDEGESVTTWSLDGGVKVWPIEAARLRRLLSETEVCLTADQRRRYLAEAEDEAERRWAACERMHGRTVPEANE